MPDIAAVNFGQVGAQQRQGQSVSGKGLGGFLEFCLGSLDAQFFQHCGTALGGELFQLDDGRGSRAVLGQVVDFDASGKDAEGGIVEGQFAEQSC